MAIRVIHKYWGRITIVARAGGYYVPPFKGYHGVTYGDPLTSTLFNVVMVAVIRRWMAVVATA